MASSAGSGSIFGTPANTRLVTIAAHVDHGKTTLADNLIASNGIISERSAGTLRYLDSDPEEQRRGITMRASAIGLKHRYVPSRKNICSNAGESNPHRDMIVHLNDSPGHTDFSQEVSSSMVACDAALLVVDAVEGMGARTQQVFRETALHQLQPILILNKVDRLQTELCLTPTEAYLRLRTLLESINAAAAAMIASAAQLHNEEGIDSDTMNSNNNNRALEEQWTFNPAAGNVIFASALFGWGFTVQGICRSLFKAGRISIKPPLLRQYLFGDFKLGNDSKILKWKQSSEDVPLFAEFALQPIWNIYQGVAMAAVSLGMTSNSVLVNSRIQPQQSNSEARIKATTAGMEQVLEALGHASTATTKTIQTVEDLQSILTQTGAGSSEEATLRALLRRYRPVADTVLDVVCEYAPSPAEAASSLRSQALALREPAVVSSAFERVREAVGQCSIASDAPCVAHVCKFLSTSKLHVRDAELTTSDGGNDTLILGLARVLSGRLKTNNSYYMYGPKHDLEDGGELQQRKIRLYLLMGSSFVRIEEVPAGHLCAVYGLEGVSYKTVTLSDSEYCQPLIGFDQVIRPLVKVHIEPEKPSDADFLERGLAMLSLADAAVEVTATDKGERILACLGEIHLEQSILDLERHFCGKEGIKLRISDPIVDFAETTDWFPSSETENYSSFFDDPSPNLHQTSIPPYNEEDGIHFARHGRARAFLSWKTAAIGVRVIPLAASIFQTLQSGKATDDADDEGEFLKLGRALNWHNVGSAKSVVEELHALMVTKDNSGNALLVSRGLIDGSCVRGIEGDEVYTPIIKESAAPATSGSEVGKNEHFYGVDEYESLQRTLRIGGPSKSGLLEDATDVNLSALSLWQKSMRGSIVAGFELGTRTGPICGEPMRNLLVILESVEIALKRKGASLQPVRPIVGGMVVSALKSGIRCALLSRPVRLMEGHLRLTLHSSLSGLGPLYQVLSRRRGKVVNDTMVDGTDLLMITAMIPQAEAFGLTPELFAKTSGEVTAPEMLFDHWERLDVDPFWIPTSEEEREDFGELQTAGDSSAGLDNTALKYIRQVRRRKGLTVDSSRTVANAEKQRTLKR
jgi:ribosome assembly protein 1